MSRCKTHTQCMRVDSPVLIMAGGAGKILRIAELSDNRSGKLGEDTLQ